MSKLNCKPGDLARYVGKVPANIGRFVRTVEFVKEPSQKWPGVIVPSWSVNPPLYMPDGSRARLVADRLLRPIRDPGEDARDETLSWLPVPTKNTETV
jgi:hypothetical protein